MNPLENLLMSCKSILPESFICAHENLFIEEHIHTLSKSLINFHENGVPDHFPPPHFSTECTPPLAESYVFFKEPMKAWYTGGKSESQDLLQKFANAILCASCKNILILMGQRLTPASITDASAIPPTKDYLISVVKEVNQQGLSVCARAWSKHAHRSPDKFWGEVKGSVADKNKKALDIVLNILENKTWWNMFGHYKHEIVCEVRLPTGHGVRWGKRGAELIGFLEPFEE